MARPITPITPCHIPAKFKERMKTMPFPMPSNSGVICASGTSEPTTTSTQIPQSPDALNSEIFRSSNLARTRESRSL